jgi:hypothetical protein
MSMDLALFGLAVTLVQALANITQALIRFRSERERRGLDKVKPLPTGRGFTLILQWR